MKKILVTGGAGFIGSHLVRLLVEKKSQVVVLDALTYAGHLENLADCLQLPLVEFVQGDIRNPAELEKLFSEFEFEAVFHLAAESHVDRSISGPSDFIQTNIVGTSHLLNAVLKYYQQLSGEDQKTFRYLQISTDEVFGSLGETGFFTESTPFQPNSPYSASKASADLLARAWIRTYGLPGIVTHCSNNYGPYQYPEKLIPVIIHEALAGRPLPVYGQGTHKRDWIHVKDHCLGLWLAYEKGRVGESYCFGGNLEKTNLELVHLITDLLDELKPREGGLSYRSQIRFVADRLGHDYRYAIDDTKAVRELGFSRQHGGGLDGFRASLKETMIWYLEHTAWREAVLKSKIRV